MVANTERNPGDIGADEPAIASNSAADRRTAYGRAKNTGDRGLAKRKSALAVAASLLFFAILLGALVFSARQPQKVQTVTATQSMPASPAAVTPTEEAMTARASSETFVPPPAPQIAPGRPQMAPLAAAPALRVSHAPKVWRPAAKRHRADRVAPAKSIAPVQPVPADFTVAFVPIPAKEPEAGSAPDEALASTPAAVSEPAAAWVVAPLAEPVVANPLSPAPAQPGLTIAQTVQPQDVVQATVVPQPVVYPVVGEAVDGVNHLTDTELGTVRQPAAAADIPATGPTAGASPTTANGP